jgi:CelD/BcsL family acetyltransferase involved in cellulose biosynthesis
MNVKVYTKKDVLFFSEWLSLWQQSSYAVYANSPQWFVSVLESFSYQEYAIVAVYEKERLVAVAPLMKEKKYGIRCYTLAPNDFVCGFPFLLDYDNVVLLKVLLLEVERLGVVFLTNVEEKAFLAFGKATKAISVSEQALHFSMRIQKDDDGSVFIKNKKKLLHKVRKNESDFTLRSFNGTTQEGLRLAFKLDKQSKKQKKGYNTFSGKETQAFYSVLAKQFKEKMRINILFYEDIPIAYEIGFIVGKTYFGNQIGYLGEYRKYAPGKVLIVRLFDFLGSQNIEIMDFGSGDNTLKRTVTDSYTAFFYVIITKNIFSRIYLLRIYALKEVLYRLLTKYQSAYKLYRLLRKKVSR